MESSQSNGSKADMKKLNSLSDVIYEEVEAKESERQKIVDLRQNYTAYLQEYQGIFVMRCQLMHQEIFKLNPDK